MSNKRRLRGAVREREQCGNCGRRIGKLDDALRLRSGAVTCPRCRQSGHLPRLACGHVQLPGALVVRNAAGDGTYRCQQCAPEAAAAAGNLRLGMPPGKDRA